VPTYFIKALSRHFPVLQDHSLVELLRGASAQFMTRSIGMVVSFALFLLISRVHGTVAAGVFSLSLTVLNLFGLVALMGVHRATVRFVAEASGADSSAAVTRIYKQVLKLAVPSTLTAGLVLFLTSRYLAYHVFNKPLLLNPLRAMAIALPFLGLSSINASAFRGLKRIAASTLVQSALPQLFTIAILSALAFTTCMRTTTPAYAFAGGTVICAILSTLAWRQTSAGLSRQAALPHKTVSISELLSVSWPMLITSAMLYVLGWTDIFLLGIFCSEADVGIYRAALKIALCSTFALEAIESIAAPKFASAFAQGRHAEVRLQVVFSSRLIVWLALPLSLGVILFARPLMAVFGPDFAAGSASLIILTMGFSANIACGVVGCLLEMTGHQKAIRNAIVVGASANVILNLLLIPRYGIVGAAIGTAVSTVLWKSMATLYAKMAFGYWVGYLPFRKGAAP